MVVVLVVVTVHKEENWNDSRIRMKKRKIRGQSANTRQLMLTPPNLSGNVCSCSTVLQTHQKDTIVFGVTNVSDNSFPSFQLTNTPRSFFSTVQYN